MTGKPKIDIKRALKYSWIATSISLLQLGLGSVVLYPDYALRNNDAVLYLVLLSFPSSIPSVLLAAPFVEGYPPIVPPPFDYLTICLAVFVSGYLQWFYFIPRIMRKPEIISLHLTGAEETRPIAATNPIRRRKSYQSNLPRVPFDKTGHSPLERAIGIKRGYVYAHEVTNACGKKSQSSRHQSLSRAFHRSCNDRKAARRRLAADRIAAPQR
jgi:hypothetical protein